MEIGVSFLSKLNKTVWWLCKTRPRVRLPMRIRSKFPMCVRDFDFMVGAYKIGLLQNQRASRAVTFL